jgi:threonyl-tRNA synthetase
MPPWLAPVQVVVASITEHQREYARQVAEELKKQGFRVGADLRDDKIGYKIRSLALQKLPYICVVGDKERQAGTVAVRARGGVDLGVMPVAAFSERLRLEVERRSNSQAA